MYIKYFKRIFDLIIILIFSIIFILLFIFFYLMNFIFEKKSVIHWSKRIGLDNKKFLMPKFRTMSLDTPQVATHKIKNSKRYLTKFGSFMRKYSIDELPQLYSVFKGDMSFVGPRPSLFNQYDLISLRKKNKISTIKPGITGWAQINGRDDISIIKKISLDKYYLKNMNLYLDIKIIFLTIFSILKKKNIKH